MHTIYHLDFSIWKSTKTIQKECERIANEEGDYKDQLSSGITFKDIVFRSRESAKNWIDVHDSGWYDNVGVKYKDGSKTMWLVKIEFHS